MHPCGPGHSHVISKILFILGVAALVYVALVALIYFSQSRMVYFPSRDIDYTPDRIGLEYSDVWLDTESGNRIHGWYVPRPGARLTVLMLHGNAGNISHRLETLQILHQIGVNTLIIDYQGYGRSQGRPSEQATYEDALAAWTYLMQNKSTADSTVVFGRSLGGAVAAWLGAAVAPAGLILESTFSSVEDMAQHHYPWLPVRLISKFHYDSINRAPEITSPTLVMHSPADTIVPFVLGQKLYDALPGEKTFVELQGGHNDGIASTGDRYSAELKKFMDSL